MKLKRISKAEILEKEIPKKKKKVTKRKLMEEKLELLQGIKRPTKEELTEIESLTKTISFSKIGSRSRSKGGNYERTIAKKFKAHYGIDLVRTPQSGGFAKKSKKADDFRGDIVSADKDIDLNLHIECKSCKTLSLQKWITQAESDCPKGKKAVVIFHKHNSSEDYVSLSLNNFLSLVDKKKAFKGESV